MDPPYSVASPRYEFLYKQAIGTQDNFLGMAYVHKDASSASCEDLVVRIDLPGASEAAQVDPAGCCSAPSAVILPSRKSFATCS